MIKDVGPESFDVTKMDNNSPELSFLRRNPILAKMATSNQGRAFLQTGLKKLKSSLGENPSDMDRLKAFTQFMKVDVAAELKKLKVNDVLLCKQAAQNLAAAFITEAVPPVGSALGNITGNLLGSFQRCQMQKNGAKLTLLDESLMSNPFHRLMNKENEVSADILNKPVGPLSDEEYQHFLQTKCTGFEDFRTKWTASCKEGSLCDLKYRSRAHRKNKRMLKEYYSNVNPELGALVAAIHDATYDPNKKDLAKRTDENNQDLAAKKYYNEKVAPLIGRPSLSKVENKALVDAQISNAADVLAQAQSAYNKSTNNGTQPFVSPSPTTTDVKLNQNQVVPAVSKNFDPLPEPVALNENTFNQPNLNFQNFVKPTGSDVEGQIKEVEKAENDIKKVAKDLRIKAQGDKEELEEIDEREKLLLGQSAAAKHALKNVFTPSKDVQRSPASLGSAPSSSQVTIKSNVSGASVGNYTGGSMSAPVVNKVVKQQGSDSMSQTLLDTKYAVNTSSTVALSNKYADLPSTPQGLVVKSQIQLPDSKTFDDLLKEQKLEELSDKLSKIILAPYKAGVVAILDPNSKNEILVKVTPKDGGKTAIMELVSTKTKVQPQVERSPASVIRLKKLQDIISQ